MGGLASNSIADWHLLTATGCLNLSTFMRRSNLPRRSGRSTGSCVADGFAASPHSHGIPPASVMTRGASQCDTTIGGGNALIAGDGAAGLWFRPKLQTTVGTAPLPSLARSAATG